MSGLVQNKLGYTVNLVESFNKSSDRNKYLFYYHIKKNRKCIARNLEKARKVKDEEFQKWISEQIDIIDTFLNETTPPQKVDGRNPKSIIATEVNNVDNIKEYKSMYATQKDLGINTGLIQMCCEGTNKVKSGISKTDGKKWKFQYK